MDIPFSEGPVNLSWPAIMKTVNDDPLDFFKEGGWSFLGDKDEVNLYILAFECSELTIRR